MISPRSRLLLASSAIVLAAPLVLAADTPTLDRLSRTQVKKGAKSGIRAIGTNFGEKVEDVSISAGSADCKVLEVKPTYINFQVPDSLPLGPATITIKIKGTTLTAKLTVADKPTEANSANEAEGQAIQTPQTTVKLTLMGGAAPSAVLEGTTAIPVGLFLECQLTLAGGNGEDDCVIENRKIRIDKPQFKVTFGPFPGKTLCPGKYSGLAEFLIEKAGAPELKAANWDRLDQKHHAAYARLWSQDTENWGTPDETKKTLEEIRTHYNDLTKGVTNVFELLERGNAAAGKSYHRKASGAGYDEAAWTDWVKARGLGATEDDLKKLKADNRFVNAGGALNETPWRDFLEKEVFKALVDLRTAHDAFHNKYVGVKNTKMDVEGYELISVVGKQAQAYATEVYAKAKIAVPNSIQNPTGIFEGHDVPSASRPEFENKRRVLLERLERVMTSTAPAPAPTPSPAGKK